MVESNLASGAGKGQPLVEWALPSPDLIRQQSVDAIQYRTVAGRKLTGLDNINAGTTYPE